MIRRVLYRLFPDVRQNERTRFAFFLALFFLVSSAETVGLAASESLFLAELGAGSLPLVFVAASLLALLGSLVYAAVVDVLRNDRLFVAMLLLGAAWLVLVGGVAAGGAPWALSLLVCLFWLYRGVFLVHAWTFASDHFDTLSSKRLFPLFAVGSSAGGVLGGLVAAALVRVGSASWLLVAWPVLLVAAATLLLANTRRLRRWIPLEAMEADDTSMERLRGAQRFLVRSSLGRWLIASSLGMVVALFVAQYAYSEIFARSFADADALARFFALFLAAANVVEIVVETAVSRWLIPRLGVPSANLLHPLLTFLSFLGLALAPRVEVAAAARLNRETLENALANPVRNLTYNALPGRYRGRVRGFLEGIVVNAGMGGAGLVLLAAGPELDVRAVCLLGGAAAIVYALANLGVRREYVRTLLDELRAGRLDLREIAREIGAGEAASLATLFDSLLEQAEAPPRLLEQLAAVLARHGFHGRLLEALEHPRLPVRRAALSALMRPGSDELVPALVRALTDREIELRLAALDEALRQGEPPDPRLVRPLRACAESDDPRERAAAAAALGAGGWPVLERLLSVGGPRAVAAALAVLPEDQLQHARERLEDAEPQVRAAALARLARSPEGIGDCRPRLLASLEHPDASVRCAALAALGAAAGPADAPAMVSCLADPAREVRVLATRSLARLGEPGLGVARALLGSDARAEVDAALAMLAELGTPAALQVLGAEFHRRLRLAWRALLSMQLVEDAGDAPARFLHLALRDAFGRHVRVAFAILEHSESPGVIRTLEKTLRFASSRVRADAIEVLSLLGHREGARLLVALLEEGPLEERSALARSRVDAPTDRSALIRAAPRFGRFARAAAAALGSGDPVPEVPMERMLLLSRVPLFSQLTLEQLEAVDGAMQELHYMQGEVITREGETGDELFVVLEGAVSISKRAADGTQIPLSTMRAGSYLGEMAILSDEPRSATAVAASPSRLLSLRGDRLKELILDMPEIAFELLRVLTGRVRTVEQRLAEQGAAD